MRARQGLGPEKPRRLTVLAGSNALIVVPEQVTALAAGDTVEVLELQP